MIRVSIKGAEARVYPDTMLENICFAYAGGGTTQAQTIKAMLLLHNIREKGIAKTDTTTIEHVED